MKPKNTSFEINHLTLPHTQGSPAQKREHRQVKWALKAHRQILISKPSHHSERTEAQHSCSQKHFEPFQGSLLNRPQELLPFLSRFEPRSLEPAFYPHAAYHQTI